MRCERAKSQIEAREINRLSKRLLALLEERESERKGSTADERYLTRLMIKASSRVMLLKVDEIDFIEADGNYAKLHVGRKTHLLREKMNDLEGRLDPAKFVRIHRSIIVNLDGSRRCIHTSTAITSSCWKTDANATQPHSPREPRSQT